MKVRLNPSSCAFTLIRLTVGWHFLYEGCWKLFQEDGWSCLSYLTAAQGPLTPLFTWMASCSWLVAMGDWGVQLGLVAIGLALITGIGARLAAAGAMALLVLFYACQPPEPFAAASSGADGHFLFIERNALEFLALGVILTRPCWRGVVTTLVPGVVVLAIFGGCVWHQYKSGGFKTATAVTSATVKVHEFTALKALKNPFTERTPFAGISVSTLALGGDLMAGHSHGRDLIWTDEFMRRYNSGATLGRTMRYCLFCGIDTVFAEPRFFKDLGAAAREVGGTPIFVANCVTLEDSNAAQQAGARALYLRPEWVDKMVRTNDVVALTAHFKDLQKSGLPVGIGAEDIASVRFCVAHNLIPAFWVVAFHSLDYPAATLPKAHNSIWCTNPEATAAYLKTRPEPWVAIRSMAGGAIDPVKAYTFARKNGAAVVALDLLDYRIVDTINGLVGSSAKAPKANTEVRK